MKTKVVVLFEVKTKLPSGEFLCLQFCRYEYSPAKNDTAYRVIRRDAKGKLKAQRGQAGFASLAELEALVILAKRADWGLYAGSMD